MLSFRIPFPPESLVSQSTNCRSLNDTRLSVPAAHFPSWEPVVEKDQQETHFQDSSIDVVPGCDLFQRSLHFCSEQRKILRHALINLLEHGRVETLQASVRAEHTRDKIRATLRILSMVKYHFSAPEKKHAYQHGQTTFCCVRRNSHEQSPGVQSVLGHVPSVGSHHHRLEIHRSPFCRGPLFSQCGRAPTESTCSFLSSSFRHLPPCLPEPSTLLSRLLVPRRQPSP